MLTKRAKLKCAGKLTPKLDRRPEQYIKDEGQRDSTHQQYQLAGDTDAPQRLKAIILLAVVVTSPDTTSLSLTKN